MDIQKLDNLYKLYRFQIVPINIDGIRVYSYTSKYFSNADIVVLTSHSQVNLEKIIQEVEELGFTASIRRYHTLDEAEESLFDGFFDVENSNRLLQNTYVAYVNKVEKVIFGRYEYIKSEYQDVEENLVRRDDLVNRIIDNLNTSGPVLILLEAAAGFGKTSTSYEIIKYYSENKQLRKIPLFTELSRNRQASIFKYVLYDEINRRFTGLSLELTKKHIIDGRIPVIIDGFDELLKQRNYERAEEKFDDAEPMLETIKELLQGEAKIILTTRRTAIFSDDDFFRWLDENSFSFTFYRYSISEPTISDWIPPSREKALQKAGLNLKSISNPVFLAYLRSLSDEHFEACLVDIDRIIEDYITKLMQRENERQDLNMTIDEQKKILKIISSYFTNQDITSESKEVLEKRIFDQEQKLLLSVLDRYPADQRPSIDQLINKLIIHAFFDRKADNEHQIGFVNDFILGSFIGSNLIDDGDSWFGTERFIDFVLTSYMPRSKSTKNSIYEILNRNLLKYLSIEKQVFIDNYLFGSINRNLENHFFKGLEFRYRFNNNKDIIDCIFSDCEFYEVDLVKDVKDSCNIYFINCNFFDCNLNTDMIENGNATFTNCQFIPEIDLSILDNQPTIDIAENNEELYKRKVLEKFWQSGKDQFNPHKRLNTLRMGIAPEEISSINQAIDDLIKEGIILQLKGHHSLHLNIQHINRIKDILRR